MKKLRYLALAAMSIVACHSPNKSSDESRKGDTSLSLEGEYEWYAGSVGQGYLYYKFSIRQVGDSIGGTVFSGMYLSKNDQGFYTMPAATMTNEISGKLDGTDAIVYLGKVLDSARMDKTYQFPAVQSLFGEDAAGDAVQTLHKKGSAVQILFEEDTAVFEPVKKN